MEVAPAFIKYEVPVQSIVALVEFVLTELLPRGKVVDFIIIARGTVDRSNHIPESHTSS